LFAEVICDLVHLHPASVKLLAKAKKPEETVLITDCMSAGGLADGEYTLGELTVLVRDGVCRLVDGTLAGSTARLIDCVKNMHRTVGVPLADAVTAGKQADIIAIDEHFNVRFVMVDGVVKWNDGL
jgi:N-acetylglucosamine-6-phosphate deacetylase